MEVNGTFNEVDIDNNHKGSSIVPVQQQQQNEALAEKKARQLIRMLVDNEPLNITLFNIPINSELTIRQVIIGDKFQPSWKPGDEHTQCHY